MEWGGGVGVNKWTGVALCTYLWCHGCLPSYWTLACLCSAIETACAH